MHSLYATFRKCWRPEAEFLWTPGGRRWTYADLDRITADLSARLRGLQLGCGDRVVSVLERSEWSIFLYLACTRAGFVYVPLNPRLTAVELEAIVADAQPAVVICAPALENSLRQVLGASQVPIRTLDGEGAGSLPVETPSAGLPDVILPADHPAAIIFTSGTTGRPKGVLMLHDLLVGKARALSLALGYTAADRLLHTLPLHHAHGLFMTLHCVLDAGASILFLPRFESSEVVRQLPHATVFSGVPTMYRRLVQEDGLTASAGLMRLFISGSAPLPGDLFALFEQRTGHRILECWGMSETMTNTANPLAGERRPGTVGRALPGVILRVVDSAGQTVPAGAEGMLEVGFSARFGSYWGRSPSEQPVLRNGFLLTGDVGRLDGDGYVTIVGRTSDVIISGGYNIHPREVEVALETLPGVAKAAVFGVPHPDFGEAVAAVLEPAPDVELDVIDLVARLRARLVGYKLPKAMFVETKLPTTELGKIQRRALAAKHAAHFDRRT